MEGQHSTPPVYDDVFIPSPPRPHPRTNKSSPSPSPRASPTPRRRGRESFSYAPPLPPKPQERFKSLPRYSVPSPYSTDVPNSHPLSRPYSVHVPNSEPRPPPVPRRASEQYMPRNIPRLSLSSRRCSTPQQLSLSDALSLEQLVKIHSHQFPLRIKVLQGYEGQTPQLCISNADVYNIHFLKHRKVVRIKDSKGHIYSVPVNSSLQFSLVYPSDNGEPSMFDKVSDILALQSLPKVVCATRSFRGSDKKTSVNENEILVIKRVHKQKFKGKKGLEVLSITTSMEKYLSADCKGGFSTDPSLIRMHPLEIVGYVPDPFPSQAVLYLSDDFMSCKQYLSASLLAGSIAMIESKTETSLIATTVIDQAKDIPFDQREIIESPLLDIPLDECLANVEVTIIHSEDTESLYEGTRQLFQNLDLTKLKSFKDTGSEQANNTQSLFYTTFKEGYERYGIELDVPSVVSRYTELPLRSQSKPIAEDFIELKSDEEDAYEEIQIPSNYNPFSFNEPRRSSIPEPSTPRKDGTELLTTDEAQSETVSLNEPNEGSKSPTFEQTRTLTPSFSTYVTMRPASTDHLDCISQHSMNGPVDENELRSTVGLLTKRVESLEKKVRELTLLVGSPLTPPGSEMESNRTQLKILTLDKIQAMLDKMSLSQYKDLFAREQITGEVLSELSEEDLQHELGVRSRVHRIRLMKVISGQEMI